MPARLDADGQASIPSPAFGRPVVERLRRLCLALPETSETTSWGHPNFRAGRKVFCAFEIVQKRPSVAFRLPSAEAEALLRGRNAFSTPYGRGLWVSLWVDDDIDWSRVAALVERGYRTVANKRMLAALEPRTPNPKPRTRNRT